MIHLKNLPGKGTWTVNTTSRCVTAIAMIDQPRTTRDPVSSSILSLFVVGMESKAGRVAGIYRKGR